MIALPIMIGNAGASRQISQPKIAAHSKAVYCIGASTAARAKDSARTMQMMQIIATTPTRNMRPRSNRLGVVHAQGMVAAPTEPRPTTRDELWGPILLLVLVGLCVEWAVYHRDALIRIRRGFGARFGRRAPDGGT